MFFDGKRLTGQHRFINAATAFGDDAIERDSFTRPDPQKIAWLNRLEANLFLAAVRKQAPGGLGGQAKQLPDSGACLATSSQFQDLAEQDQAHQRHRRLIVRLEQSRIQVG